MSRLLLDLREASDMDVNNDNDEYISLSKTCSEVMFVTHEGMFDIHLQRASQ